MASKSLPRDPAGNPEAEDEPMAGRTVVCPDCGFPWRVPELVPGSEFPVCPRCARREAVGPTSAAASSNFFRRGRRFATQALIAAGSVYLFVSLSLLGESLLREPRPGSGVASARSDSDVGRGRELFLREWTANDSRSHGGDGLGPLYNDTSCVACHNLGGAGGGAPNGKNVDVISFVSLPAGEHMFGGRINSKPTAEDQARAQAHPGFHAADSLVLHRFGTSPDYLPWRLARLESPENRPKVWPIDGFTDGPPEELAKLDLERSRLPTLTPGPEVMQRARARVFRNGLLQRAQRNPTALFGAGLIDAIPAGVIRDRARRSSIEYPGVGGRVNDLGDGKVGRFGWKAQLPTLRQFVLTACAVELGLEVPGHPQGGDPLAPEAKAPGLDLVESECDDLLAFVRSLPAPSRQLPATRPEAEAVQAGRGLFASIGCAQCHTPDLGDVQGIYSDLLLHDMGPELGDTGTYGVFRPDQVADGSSSPARRPRPAAEPNEWRTPPLWGVRDSAPYLHDGRADTLEQAIAFHGGRASAYFKLSALRRQQVQSFLKSLAAPRE